MASQENNRNRASISISGIDTSTSSHSVEDGKCEELHNLRFASGSWHNVDPLKIKQDLHPAEGQEELFSKLTIIYHHPAAGDDTYIASAPNASGNLYLYMVKVENGELKVYSDKICPIYIDEYIYESGSNVWFRVRISSLIPVASDVSVNVNYRPMISGQRPGSVTLTILKGTTTSESYKNNAQAGDNSSATASPMKDNEYIYQVFSDKAEAEQFGGAFARNLPPDIKISHFGNVLIVIIPSEQRVIYYVLDDTVYKEFQIPERPVVRQDPTLGLDGVFGRDQKKCTGIYQYRADDITNGRNVPIYNISTGSFYIPQINAESFWGEICFFAAFQMFDGSVVSPSALNIAISEPFKTGIEGRNYGSWATTDLVMNLPLFKTWEENGEKIFGASRFPYDGYDTRSGCTTATFWIKPYISISIPKWIDSELIKSVVIYSTRINPIWDAEKLKDLNAPVTLHDASQFLADNRLPEQPFYFVESIPLDDFTDGEYKMYLGADLLDGIEHNSTYEPVDMHSLFYDVVKEYNSRMHIGGNAGLRLFEGYGDDFFSLSESDPGYSIMTNIRIDDRDYRVSAPSRNALNDDSQFIYNRILSYPDYRATFMYAPSATNIEDVISPKIIKLKSAITTNFAWAVNGTDSERAVIAEDPYSTTYHLKYSASMAGIMETPAEYYEATDAVVPLNNKLRVSAANNPFSFPLANSYAIGSGNNRIIAVNSAAIEMSDAKFGEFPLYVFTEEGIFALQSGSGEILYSSTIPINYDRIINPITLAVNYNILYITDRGIMAMSSEGVSLISEPVNDLHNTPPIEFLRTAYLCYHPSHNEVFAWNPELPKQSAGAGSSAYVYSLSGHYWTTRDIDGIKLNTNELIVRENGDHIRILDIDNEEFRPDQVIKARIVSRPLKLGSTEYKRLETLVLRLHALEPQPIRILIEGSTDLKTWITLRDTGAVSADRDVLLRRFPCSMCYLRLTLEASVASQLDLTRFDMEYYLRFHHRLR
jgi:hypothetical protein